jgi:hypothetical protein
MMEAARTSETSVNFYQTTRHYNPEDSHLLSLELSSFPKYGLRSYESLIYIINCTVSNVNAIFRCYIGTHM